MKEGLHKRLEEAAKKSVQHQYNCKGEYPCTKHMYCEMCEGHNTPYDCCECGAGDFKEGFIAGAEWQKEQDQPITGNSLEQEWLRYVDKKTKESGGELPALGEYGWLQIARHFANWQKQQMIRDCSVQACYEAEIEKAEERGYNEAIAQAKEWLKEQGKDWWEGYGLPFSIADFETDMNKLWEEKK